MNTQPSVFAQVMAFLPLPEFRKCVRRYRGDYRVRKFSCLDQFSCLAFAQLTYRESLRDIVSCLKAVKSRLYHMGIRGRVSRNNLANANEARDWRIYADFYPYNTRKNARCSDPRRSPARAGFLLHFGSRISGLLSTLHPPMVTIWSQTLSWINPVFIDHLKLTFVADRPPPVHLVYQEVLTACAAFFGRLERGGRTALQYRKREAKMPNPVCRIYDRLLTSLLVIAFLPGAILGRTNAEDAAGRIDRLLAGRYAADAPGAAVLVARKGTVVLRKGYGLANLEHRIAASPQTVFRLASVSKVFTAAAVLILAEKGQLGLDDPASKYIADYPWKKGVPALRDLLGHTSGIHDYLDRPDNMRWVRGEYTVKELIDSFKDRDPDFAPGERMAYSNSNYILLGAILEKVVGQPLSAAVQDLVLRPLGLKQTFYDEELTIIPGRAAGYEPFRNKDDSLDCARFRNVRYYTMSCLYASGGYLSTVDDLYAFYRGLADGKFLGRDMFSRSLEPVRLAGSKTAGGSVGGWQIDRLDGRMVYMKGGALPGVCTWMLFLPDEDLCVVFLSNRSAGEPRCGQVALEIAKLALAS